LSETRQGYEKKIKNLEEELAQKESYIEELKQEQIQTQERVKIL